MSSGVDDVVREGSRRFDALEPPELGEKVELYTPCYLE